MKKIALFTVLFALVLTCAACGKKKPSADVSNDTTTAAGDTDATTTAGNEIGADDLLPPTGKPVTRVVTDKGGKTVTDKEQKPVTEVVTRVVTDKDGKTVTDKEQKPVTEVVTEPVATAPTKPNTSTTKSGETTKIIYEDLESWSPIKPY